MSLFDKLMSKFKHVEEIEATLEDEVIIDYEEGDYVICTSTNDERCSRRIGIESVVTHFSETGSVNVMMIDNHKNWMNGRMHFEKNELRKLTDEEFFMLKLSDRLISKERLGPRLHRMANVSKLSTEERMEQSKYLRRFYQGY